MSSATGPVSAVLLAGLAAAIAAQEPGTEVGRVDFSRDVVPILVARCCGCHGPDDQQGGLRLDAREHVLPAGGPANGTVVPGDPEASELLRRITLPPDDDDLMPARGGPLPAAQQLMIRRWIAGGADWPAAGDAALAAALVAQALPKTTFVLPPIDSAAEAAIAAAIAAVRNAGGIVQRVAADTEALQANLSMLRQQADDELLVQLLPLAPRLVWLDVARTAITDGGAAHIAALRQLRRLNAAGTTLGDAAFGSWTTLHDLETLNAYGTGLGDRGLAALARLPRLQRLYVWRTRVSPEGVAAARAANSRLSIDTGDYAEGRLAAARGEVGARAARPEPVNERCPVSGKPVDPACTLEHGGRCVGFCCGDCRTVFVADPARYLDGLPPGGG